MKVKMEELKHDAAHSSGFPKFTFRTYSNLGGGIRILGSSFPFPIFENQCQSGETLLSCNISSLT